MDKKQKIIVLASIGIVGVFLILCLAGAGIFVFSRRSNKAAPAQVNSTQSGRLGMRIPGNFDISQICDIQRERQPRFETEIPSNSAEPEGMGERRALITEICEDGEVSDEEQAQLEEQFQNMPQPIRGNRQFMNN
jgi:hypothetical protein